MKVHGWCEGCRKVKLIPLNARAAVTLTQHGVPMGLCDDCLAPKPQPPRIRAVR